MHYAEDKYRINFNSSKLDICLFSSHQQPIISFSHNSFEFSRCLKMKRRHQVSVLFAALVSLSNLSAAPQEPVASTSIQEGDNGRSVSAPFEPTPSYRQGFSDINVASDSHDSNAPVSIHARQTTNANWVQPASYPYTDYVPFAGVDLYGVNDISSFNTPVGCNTRCNQTATCVAFVSNAVNCWLKYSPANPYATSMDKSTFFSAQPKTVHGLQLHRLPFKCINYQL